MCVDRLAVSCHLALRTEHLPGTSRKSGMRSSGTAVPLLLIASLFSVPHCQVHSAIQGVDSRVVCCQRPLFTDCTWPCGTSQREYCGVAAPWCRHSACHFHG